MFNADLPLIRHSEDNLEDAKEHLRSLHGDYMDVAKPTILRLAWCLDEIDHLKVKNEKLLFFATTLAHYPCAAPKRKAWRPANCMECGPCKSRYWEEGNG
ncbi:hypothetical protein LCGC14_1500820 [marine sediment metagenome]|uniref:Uncharacterized protein n=1 Tax=marine sediment metagenome TaxID=412755 RepID=A0A0F9JPZ1_9ZZZZ